VYTQAPNCMFKKTSLLVFLFSLLLHHYAMAQLSLIDSIATSKDSILHVQADSLKKIFNADGFMILREATIEMRSQYEKPVVVSFKAGTLYRVCFIGDYTSRVYELRMYDWEERKMVHLKQKPKDNHGNLIIYDYVPNFTELHMIKPIQINRKSKNINGYMMLFKKIMKRE
jgi:hypothetical protein